MFIQYFYWLKELLIGNLGFSFRTGKPVLEMIASRIGPTFLLTFMSLVMAYVIAIPIGIISAIKPYTFWDYGSTVLAFLTAATPNFFLGLVCIFIFSVRLKLLPIGGMYYPGGEASISSLLIHLLMPSLVLAAQQFGSVMRHIRSGILEICREDYVRTARAKGVVERVVILKHILANSLIPIVTLLGLSIPFLVGGAVVTEQVFGWPGLGSLMVQSINARDYPVIMGITVVIAIAVLLGNLLADIAYGVLNPRISYQ